MGNYILTKIKVEMPKSYHSWEREKIFEFRSRKLVRAFQEICKRGRIKFQVLPPKGEAVE